jgi:glycine hydroxymethyltransferase
VAVQLKEVATPEFKAYAQQIVANCRALAASLMKRGYILATGGTDNHLILWDLRPQKLTGNKYEYLCDEVSITLNKNSIHGDTSALTPGGVRVGTPALTSRGFKEADFEQVAEFLHRAVEVAVEIQTTLAAALPATTTGKAPVVKLESFKDAVHSNEKVKALKAEVEAFSKKFFMPGFDVTTLKYSS